MSALDDLIARTRALWSFARLVPPVLVVLLVLILGLGWWWSFEPEAFDVRATAARAAAGEGRRVAPGVTITATLVRVVETLLGKSGGYLSNDVMPPGVLLDNIPNFELGALVQLRDLARAMRDQFSRSQSQSTEDRHLKEAEPLFHFSNDSWILPSTESQYQNALDYTRRYLDNLARAPARAEFHPRSDNLRLWLGMAGTRLGSLSQRLAASVGRHPLNLLASDGQKTSTVGQERVQTPWLEIDDVFYEARGAAWALSHFLQAVAVDFDEVLREKNARVSLEQIVRELEAAQAPLYSPMVLNGGGFGMLPNHSLVLASYISRANAALIDLRNLLSEG